MARIVVIDDSTVIPEILKDMSSATGTRDLLQVARRMGASATLEKPFSKIELLAAVAPFLAEKPGLTGKARSQPSRRVAPCQGAAEV